ncbi:MAG: response regulator [Polyangiaceae bacterium]|nr:response regulator [Polyangiaceae bacterium]
MTRKAAAPKKKARPRRTSAKRDAPDLAAALAALDRGERGVRLPVEGESAEVAARFNRVAERIDHLARDVGDVATRVAVDGQLDARVPATDHSGSWRELAEGVNRVSSTLTMQVRELAKVTTAVAHGDVSQMIRLEVGGEVLQLKNTINRMVLQLESFGAQVTRVAKEFSEGILGGHVEVSGVSGIWKDLVDSINVLSERLTRQVRAVAGSVRDVARGDLRQRLEIDARGEVGELADTINLMIRTLAETTKKNEEQDWLKTSLARLSRMLQGQRDLATLAKRVLSELAGSVGVQRGTFYVRSGRDDAPKLVLLAAYACAGASSPPSEIALGEGLLGQAAIDGAPIVVTNVPEGYASIGSSLGNSTPAMLLVTPIHFEGRINAVVELASLEPFTAVQRSFLDQFFDSLGIVLASVETQMQLEEKAEQLALASKYKSQFLANMSHELRTPLNSLLILSRQLADNRAGNLDEREVHYAKTIHQAGADLLELINEILDLAKVESGTMHVERRAMRLDDLAAYVQRSFEHVAGDKKLDFAVSVDPSLPGAISTDELRLKQVVRNLLANAFKFTERGAVRLEITRVSKGPGGEGAWVSFSVIDSGIGIPESQQKLVFEAFQQADGTITRRYGGTGLGLAISREIAQLLGGDIRVESRPGIGSTFTLRLPLTDAQTPNVAPRPSQAIVRADNITPPPNGILEGRTVLVVDDDVRNIFALTAVLEHYGIEVVFAENGKDALERLEERPDIELVLMDIMMPEMDGLEATRRIRAQTSTANLPVVALTAKAMCGDREQCIEAGASGYVSKPVDPDELIAAMTACLVESGRRSTTAQL